MHHTYKPHTDQSLYAHLAYSAVCRPASPSPSKLFYPSSSFHQNDSIGHFKMKGSFCSPQTHKKHYLRNTVEPTPSYAFNEITVISTQNHQHRVDVQQVRLQAERSPFKAICFNQEGGRQKRVKNEVRTVEMQVAQDRKNNFQIQQPLFNKIIKRIDDKQKILSQIRRIADIKLPTRNIRPQQRTTAHLLTNKSKAMNHSFLSNNYIASETYKQNPLKERYLNTSISNSIIATKNPEEKEVKPKQSAYFTPKTMKSYDVEEQMKSTSSSTLYKKHSTPQNIAKSTIIDKEEPSMKKRSFIAYELVTSQIRSETKTNRQSTITSLQALMTQKQGSKQPKLSDFIIAKTLGEGKFGTVLKVIHKQSGFTYALKKISKATIKSHMMIQQLAIQIRIQSFCNHRNIAKLYAVFDDSQYLYLLLEYMEEGTLFSYLKKQQKLEEIEAANTVREIAEAVRYLHDQGIAHRDIKPENIVLTNGMSKLCDFGWAAICNQRRRTYCGTFDYAAPQILQGSEYDMSVDMWCLGVLAYELLVGKAPFYHISRKQTMKKIMNVSSSNIDFPSALSKNAKDFIKKLLIKQPQQRMTAQAVLKHPFLAQLASQ